MSEFTHRLKKSELGTFVSEEGRSEPMCIQRGHETIEGELLKEGDTLEAQDLYESSAGRWEPCPCPGLILGKVSTRWVRPAKRS